MGVFAFGFRSDFLQGFQKMSYKIWSEFSFFVVLAGKLWVSWIFFWIFTIHVVQYEGGAVWSIFNDADEDPERRQCRDCMACKMIAADMEEGWI
jgi:hypothetical protein